MRKLEDYQRVLVVQALNHDDRVAAVRPFALVADRYIQKLPDEEVGGEFGLDFETLLAKKGIETALQIGDTFRTYNPHQTETIQWVDGRLQIVGEYLAEVEVL